MPATANHPAAFALIIGLGRYADPRIAPLRFVRRDAEAFRDQITHPRRAAVPPANVRMLLDEQATLVNIKSSLSTWLYKNSTADDTVFIFFAGHGHHESDKTGTERDGIAKYLLPYDAQPDDLFASALSASEFNRMLATVKARRVAMFMDACYSGGLSGTTAGARDLAVRDPYRALHEGEGRVVIAAAKPNQRSWEDESLQHGIFTHHLLEALSGKADTDDDGVVSLLEVFRYLERHVPASARRLANSDQDPLFWGDLAKDIKLTVDTDKIDAARQAHASAQAARAADLAQRQDRLHQMLRSGELRHDLYAEATALLALPQDQHDRRDVAIAILLAQLSAGSMTPADYAKARDAIVSSMQGAASGPAHRGTSTAPERRYCTRCGAANAFTHNFCTTCGRALVDTRR